MKDKIKYLNDRYDELMWQAQNVGPLEELNIWGQWYSERWRHERISFRSEDGAAYEKPDIAAHVHFNSWDPVAVLAHLAALRAVLAMVEQVDSMAQAIEGEWGLGSDDVEGPDILKALLQPFAGRADFPEAWKA